MAIIEDAFRCGRPRVIFRTAMKEGGFDFVTTSTPTQTMQRAYRTDVLNEPHIPMNFHGRADSVSTLPTKWGNRMHPYRNSSRRTVQRDYDILRRGRLRDARDHPLALRVSPKDPKQLTVVEFSRHLHRVPPDEMPGSEFEQVSTRWP
ncbi:MAG: hypothetical protein H6816_11460 [Phycisphaerales bacterium]|nr:hypothetical protein [Phycisphaerales bacterium]